MADSDTKTLEKQVADLTKERDGLMGEMSSVATENINLKEKLDATKDLPKQVEALTKERDAAVARADKASSAHSGLLGEHKTVGEQLAAMTKEREAAVARAEKAEKAAGAKPKASPAAKSAARKVAKPDWGENDVDRPKAAELLEAIEDAETVEIVASDGTHEIRELGAFATQGNQPFRVALQGLIADVGDGVAHGPAGGSGGSFRVEGFGLFLDGKLAAYAPLLTPMGIGAGQQVSFRDAVVF